MIADVLGHLKSDQLINYIDDTIILGTDFKIQLQNMDQVLKAFADNGLIINIDKCVLIKEEIDFLGQCISNKGIKQVKKYIRAIEYIPLPTNLKQLRSLIGKFKYYSRYIQDHALILNPLTELVKGHTKHSSNTPITLTAEPLGSIKTMKNKLTNAPILSYTDFYSDEKFIATTDASFEGIGYIISQIQEGIEGVICYGSRKLSDAEKH